jgi:Domain of unknown function (DUF4397)
MKRSRGFYAGMLAGGVVLLAGGCKNNRDTGAVTTKTEQGTSNAPSSETLDKSNLALVRVVNASPADPSLVVFAGDSTAFSGVGYKKATGFQEIPDDRFNFKLGSRDKPLAENRENLSGGGHYTIIAMPDQGGADKRNLRVLDDDLKPVSPDKARVRVINAIPGDAEVSVFIRGRADPLFDGINFKSEAGWNEFDPIAGTLEVRPQGKKNVLAREPNVKLEGGKSYTFVVAGTPAKVDIIKIEDDVAKNVSSN